MSAPRLLAVDLAALQTELDGLRDEFVTAHLRDQAQRSGFKVYDQDAAEQAWADAYPALELLRDEIR